MFFASTETSTSAVGQLKLPFVPGEIANSDYRDLGISLPGNSSIRFLSETATDIGNKPP